MTLNDDLAAWGEPPATPAEEALAVLLDLVECTEDGDMTPAPLPQRSPALNEQGALLLRDLEQLRAAATSVWAYAVPVGDRGTVLGPAADPFPGEFRIEGLAGTGAFGQVYQARDVVLDRPVALKTLRLTGPAKARALALLQQEARLLAAVRHPNVVQVYAWRQAAGDHYLVLQYVAGGALAARVTREGPLPWHLAARYVADVGEGLREVHAQGVVHRDVKPDNILWDPQRDEALLTDFGVSARLGCDSGAGGTPSYMAPEAFDGQVSPALDVYGLAASLFWLLTGELPFTADTINDLVYQVERGLPRPERRLEGVPEALEQVVRAGLSAAPGQRPGLDEFLRSLRGALNRLLADTLLFPPTAKQPPVRLRLIVSRQTGPQGFVPLESQPLPGQVLRDLKRVPPAPDQVRLRTGDRVRVEVEADRPGYVTVFNVGPTGNLNLLYPEPTGAEAGQFLPASQPLHVLDAELTPPAGRERLFALWSRTPLPLHPGELLSLAEQGRVPGSGPYRATRDLVRVRQSTGQVAAPDWHAVVLELEHEPPQENNS
jgi:serine/threonine-protein kinase